MTERTRVKNLENGMTVFSCNTKYFGIRYLHILYNIKCGDLMSFVMARKVSHRAQCLIFRDVILGFWQNLSFFQLSAVYHFHLTFAQLKQFQVKVLFLYPLKVENQRLSVFRGYRKVGPEIV